MLLGVFVVVIEAQKLEVCIHMVEKLSEYQFTNRSDTIASISVISWGDPTKIHSSLRSKNSMPTLEGFVLRLSCKGFFSRVGEIRWVIRVQAQDYAKGDDTMIHPTSELTSDWLDFRLDFYNKHSNICRESLKSNKNAWVTWILGCASINFSSLSTCFSSFIACLFPQLCIFFSWCMSKLPESVRCRTDMTGTDRF